MITSRIEIYENDGNMKDIAHELIEYLCENFVTEEDKHIYFTKGEFCHKYAVTFGIQEVV